MWAPEWKRRQVRAMREAREAMNDRTMVEFPGGDMGDVTRADTSVWASYQTTMVKQSLAEAAAHAMFVPNHAANPQLEMVREPLNAADQRNLPGDVVLIRNQPLPPPMLVPNHVANLQAEIARLKAELAAVKPAPAADVAPAGKGPIPARTLRQPGLQRIGLLVGRG